MQSHFNFWKIKKLNFSRENVMVSTGPDLLLSVRSASQEVCSLSEGWSWRGGSGVKQLGCSVEVCSVSLLNHSAAVQTAAGSSWRWSLLSLSEFLIEERAAPLRAAAPAEQQTATVWETCGAARTWSTKRRLPSPSHKDIQQRAWKMHQNKHGPHTETTGAKILSHNSTVLIWRSACSPWACVGFLQLPTQINMLVASELVVDLIFSLSGFLSSQ